MNTMTMSTMTMTTLTAVPTVRLNAPTFVSPRYAAIPAGITAPVVTGTNPWFTCGNKPRPEERNP